MTLPESFLPGDVIQPPGTGEVEYEIRLDAAVARPPDPSGRTQALEGGQQVDAGGAGSARPDKTLVDVVLAEEPVEPWRALAAEGTHQVVASGAIAARIGKTFIHRLFA